MKVYIQKIIIFVAITLAIFFGFNLCNSVTSHASDIPKIRINCPIAENVGSHGTYVYSIEVNGDNVGYFPAINSKNYASWFFYSTTPQTISVRMTTDTRQVVGDIVDSWVKDTTFSIILTQNNDTNGLYMGYLQPPQIGSCSIEYGYTLQTYSNQYPNDIYYRELSSILVDGSILGNGNLNIPFVSDIADNNIGHLIGMEKYYKETNLTVGGFGLMAGTNKDLMYNFGWDTVTSTGFDLLNNAFDSTYVEMLAVPNFDVTLSNGSKFFPTSHGKALKVGEFLPETQHAEVKWSELMALIEGYDTEIKNANKENGGNSWNTADCKITWNFYFKVCCVKDGQTYYGQTVRFIPKHGFDKFRDDYIDKPTVNVSVGSFTDYDNKTGFEVDNNSSYLDGKDFQGTSGSGANWHDALINSGVNVEVDNSLLSNMEDFVKQIGNVPDFIGSLFSFLPSWILGYVSIAFGLTVTVLVLKIVRG